MGKICILDIMKRRIEIEDPRKHLTVLNQLSDVVIIGNKAKCQKENRENTSVHIS